MCIITKQCIKCNNILPLDAFHNDIKTSDGKYPVCRLCRAILKKEKYKKYPPSHNKYNSENIKKKKLTDPNFHIRENLRCQLRHLIHKQRFSKKFENIIGCDWNMFKLHMEALFSNEMSWDNYGSYWCVDHIKPCVMFDLTKKEQQKECFHYTNIQPLERNKNCKKASSYNGYNTKDDVRKEFEIKYNIQIP